MRTFVRVLLSKLLGALGDALTTRILLLRGEVSVATDRAALFEKMACEMEKCT